MTTEKKEITDNLDFISLTEYNNYEKSGLKKFMRYAPNQENDGYYRVGFFGKVSNSASNWQGYLSTSAYFLYQLKCVKNFAFNTVEFIATGSDFSVISIILLILGFILGILIRLPIGILLTIIQFVVVLFASKK